MWGEQEGGTSRDAVRGPAAVTEARKSLWGRDAAGGG